MTAQFTLQQCLQHILNIYIQYCSQLHYAVNYHCYYIGYPFHNVIFFHNDCTIHSTTMSTAYPQHIHTVLFTITLPSILTVLFTFTFPFTMWIFFHDYCIIVYSTMFTVRLHWILTVLFTITLPSILSVLFIYAVLFTMWYFSSITAQLTLQQCLQHILNIYIRYCYNYTTQYTDFAVYICFLYTMWHFFTMTAQFTLQQCLQHILNIYIQYCSQLHYPVYWLCSVYMLPLHNVTFFNNYCTSDSTTMSIAYPQHIHIVLFTTTLHSILALLFIYASFTQCDIFSQLLHNWLYNNVYSISSTYTCGTVYNYTTQYADF